MPRNSPSRPSMNAASASSTRSSAPSFPAASAAESDSKASPQAFLAYASRPCSREATWGFELTAALLPRHERGLEPRRGRAHFRRVRALKERRPARAGPPLSIENVRAGYGLTIRLRTCRSVEGAAWIRPVRRGEERAEVVP